MIDNMICYLTNAQSFLNKYDELISTVIDIIHPHIIGITESWCDQEINEGEIYIAGYTVYRQDRMDARGGGVLLYISDTFKSTACVSLNSHQFEDSIWCTITLDKKMKLLVGVCYRSTASSEYNNRSLLDLISKSVETQNITHTLIMGDFNYPSIQWENMSEDLDRESELFYNNIQDNLFVQHIDMNTRYRIGNAPSRLDLVFTNERDIDSLPPLGCSDHVGISFKLVISTTIHTQTHEANRLNYHKADFLKMNTDFKNTRWNHLFKHKSVQCMWKIFADKYHTTVEDCTQMYDETKKKNPPWLKARVKRQSTKKRQKWNQYLATGRYIDHVKYNEQNNKTISVVRDAKANYEKKLIQNYKRNPKPFFKYMRTKQMTKSTLRQLEKEDGAMTASDLETANLLQEFFTSIFTDEDISTTPALDTRHITTQMTDIIVTEAEVCHIMNQLKENKSPGSDNIHPMILKRCSGTLSIPLCLIFRKSLEEARLPQEWKDANITALHKKGSKSHVGNYRPVSLTSKWSPKFGATWFY